MCYDAAFYAKKLEKIEKHYGQLTFDRSVWIKNFQVSAFANAKIPVIDGRRPHEVHQVYWGFVPKWVKDQKQAVTWKNRTLNCRADTLLEKIRQGEKSLFKSVVNAPSVILMDGFFEWHTLPDGTKIPYYITLKDEETFAVAGFDSVWNDFADPERRYVGCTLCTIEANGLLGYIHNQPRNSVDYRMPCIIRPEQINDWLHADVSAVSRLEMLSPFDSSEMKAHSVVNFKKKDTRLGNVPEAIEPFDYELEGAPVLLDGAEFED